MRAGFILNQERSGGIKKEAERDIMVLEIRYMMRLLEGNLIYSLSIKKAVPLYPSTFTKNGYLTSN